jgi:hypothetical protein
MDLPGLSPENMLDIAWAVAGECRRGSFRLAGLDIMELKTHFMGIETGGVRDETLALVKDFISTLLCSGIRR